MNNVDEEILTITMEECAEVIQACSKIIRFGSSNKNIKELEKEFGDLLCMLELLHDYDYVSFSELERNLNLKKEKLKKWSSIPLD